MFVPPTWFEGALFYASFILIPLVFVIIFGVLTLISEDGSAKEGMCIIACIFFILCMFAGPFIGSVAWHNEVEVPSVQEKVITVDDWQPTFGKYWGEVNSAEDLMLKTTDGELFGNEENFLFQKFNTRDILDQLKPNGTYKIKYYGWREGYNNGVPNILSVEQVINETNTPAHHDISDYMNKRSIIYADDNDWR